MYEGEWKADKKEGRGTYRYADGRIAVGFYMAGADVGEGVRWSADGQAAERLRDGEPVEAISLEEALRIASDIGVPRLPEKPWVATRQGLRSAARANTDKALEGSMCDILARLWPRRVPRRAGPRRVWLQPAAHR